MHPKPSARLVPTALWFHNQQAFDAVASERDERQPDAGLAPLPAVVGSRCMSPARGFAGGLEMPTAAAAMVLLLSALLVTPASAGRLFRRTSN